MTHGIVVSDSRMDLLDRLALVFALNTSPGVAVDIGCGGGAQGIRLVSLGWDTTLYDLADISDRIKFAQELFLSSQVRSVAVDLATTQVNIFPENIKLAFSQRFIHYLTYAKALELLRDLHERMTIGARLFISTANIESELGDGYSELDKPVTERFGYLSPTMQAKHSISSRLCLYSKAEFSQLLTEAGFTECDFFTSAFGALKGVYEPL